MINETYQAMLNGKSVIRMIGERASARRAQIGASEVFDFSLGNPSVPCAPEFTSAMIDLYETQAPYALHGYSPSVGIESVRGAIADSLNRRFGMDYTPAHIFPTAGATAALAHAFRAVAEPGSEIITFAPYFPEYQPYVAGTGATLTVVPADTAHFQIDFDAFERALNPRVAAVLINTPNNPSGAVYSEQTLRRLAQILEERGSEWGHSIFLISDEPYREIVFGGAEQPYPARFYANTLTCYSFSKALSLPGERIGYVAVNPRAEHAELLVPMFAQIRYSALVRLGFTVEKPGGTFYIFPQSPIPDAMEFCEQAMEYDLFMVPSDSFGVPGHLRLSYCMETDHLERAIERLEQFMRERYGR